MDFCQVVFVGGGGGVPMNNDWVLMVYQPTLYNTLITTQKANEW